jgi:hypothetical protein
MVVLMNGPETLLCLMEVGARCDRAIFVSKKIRKTFAFHVIPCYPETRRRKYPPKLG